jgi:hypothetical protein
MPVQADLLAGLDLVRDLHTVGTSVGVLEAENGAHAAYIGIYGAKLDVLVEGGTGVRRSLEHHYITEHIDIIRSLGVGRI